MIAAEFSRSVAVDSLAARPRTFDIAADAAECEALARRFGILAVSALAARVSLTRLPGTLVQLQGHLAADVVQTCVVTLEPVPAHIEEDFIRTYDTAPVESDREVVVDLDAEEPPDAVVDGQIDIGEAAAEHLALSLDPFPRAPGAAFQVPPEDETSAEPAATGPFAALAALKK
jgi:uncharacterized metal-binding protein YceD (DUF177 family)